MFRPDVGLDIGATARRKVDRGRMEGIQAYTWTPTPRVAIVPHIIVSPP